MKADIHRLELEYTSAKLKTRLLIGRE